MDEIIRYEDVESKIIEIRKEHVILDRDVAVLYGVETRDINKSVQNNSDKFLDGYVFELHDNEKKEVVENFHHLRNVRFSPVMPKAFTEKGLYMLATILKSPVATKTTIAIVEAFANLRILNRSIKQAPSTVNEHEQKSLATKVGAAIIRLFDDELMELTGAEQSMEVTLPFVKLKRSVTLEKRKD